MNLIPKRSLQRLSLSALRQQQRLGHTVRIIAVQDFPNGKAYQGDVLEVKAGFARNFLIPQKIALYATRQNFAKLNMKDPDHESLEERRERLARESASGDDKALKDADLLKYYLRNKVLKVWRNIDPITNAITPGKVDAGIVRKKLAKQLKIDLEQNEAIHVRAEPLLATTAASSSELTDKDLEAMMEEMGDVETPCSTEIRQLGEFLARISVTGGYSIPLRIEVLKR